MTPALRASLRAVIGPMTSDRKCDAVVRAVLEGIREPTGDAVMIGAWELSETDDVGKAYTSMINALLSQGETVE